MEKQLRGILLKLQNRLSDDDRLRLHFYIGNDVPRTYRDDITLRGTLQLMDSLIDQDIINEQDYSFLVDAFDEIQCHDAATLLRKHLKQNQLHGLNQSMQSLSLIMPLSFNDLLTDDDKGAYQMASFVDNQKNDGTANRISTIDIHENQSKKKQILFPISTLWKIVLIMFLVALVGYGLFLFIPKINNTNTNERICESGSHYRWANNDKNRTISQGNTSIAVAYVQEMDYLNISCANTTISSRLVIFSAIYQPKWDPPICWGDETHTVRRKCPSTKSCLLHVQNNTFSETLCPGSVKELVVTYACTADQSVFGPVWRNADSPGGDIEQNGSMMSQNVASMEVCAFKCLETFACVGVVYAPNSRVCWLKRKMVQRTYREDRDSMVVFNLQ